jgi:hypothetical protein
VLPAGTEIPESPETLTSPKSVKIRRSAVASIGLGLVKTAIASRPARVDPPTIEKSLLGLRQEAAAKPRIEALADSCAVEPVNTKEPWDSCSDAFKILNEVASCSERDSKSLWPPSAIEAA